MSFSGYYSPRLFLTSLLPLLNEIPRFKEKNKFQQYQVQQFVFLRMEVPDRVWANYLKSECTPLQTSLLFSLFDISVSHSALSPPELINSGSPNILPAYQGSLCKRSPTGGFQGQMKCNPSVSSHLKYTQCFFFFFFPKTMEFIHPQKMVMSLLNTLFSQWHDLFCSLDSHWSLQAGVLAMLCTCVGV